MLGGEIGQLSQAFPNPSAPACQWQAPHPKQGEPTTPARQLAADPLPVAPAETAAELFPSPAAPKTTAADRSLPSGPSPVGTVALQSI